jgi:hypothetical protein
MVVETPPDRFTGHSPLFASMQPQQQQQQPQQQQPQQQQLTTTTTTPPPNPTKPAPIPIPKPVDTHEIVESLVIPDLSAKFKGKPLSEAVRDQFEDILRTLTQERAKIRDAMGFALDHVDSAPEVCDSHSFSFLCYYFFFLLSSDSALCLFIYIYIFQF